MTLQIPRREDFDVSHQVYEWLRELSTTIQSLESDDMSESINALLGFFKQIEEEIDALKDVIDDRELENAKLQQLVSQISELQSIIDTNELLNAKIRQLEESVSLIPEESEISLFKAFKGLKVVTKEYTGTFASPNLTEDVPIDEIFGQGACSVEISTFQAISSSTLVTCRFIDSETVRLERGQDADNVQYVLKVEDWQNG